MLDSDLQVIALAWLEATTQPKRNKAAKELAEFPKGTKEYNCHRAMGLKDDRRVTCYSIPYGDERKRLWAEIKADEKGAKAKPSAKRPAKAAKPSASAPTDEVEMLTTIATQAALAAVQAYLAAKG